MVPPLNSGSKLRYVVYIILVTCVVFLMFELANDKGKRAEISDAGSYLVSSPIVNISVSEAVVSDTSENVISTLTDSDQQFESKDKPSSSHSEQMLIKMNLMFIKTHKCGTSTLVDVFYLRGVRKKLNFVMIPYTHKLSSLTLRQVNT